jgi:hypothetical protein
MTAETHPSFSTRRRERFCRRAPNKLQAFFTCIAHAVGHRPHTALTCLQGIFMHSHRMDYRGSVKHLWATTGVSTHRQEHGTRQLPLWRVVVSSRCLRLASAPPWERHPEISKSRISPGMEPWLLINRNMADFDRPKYTHCSTVLRSGSRVYP